jgi:hypothetical protein
MEPTSTSRPRCTLPTSPEHARLSDVFPAAADASSPPRRAPRALAPLNSCSTIRVSSSVFSPDVGEVLLGVALVVCHSLRADGAAGGAGDAGSDAELAAFDEARVAGAAGAAGAPPLPPVSPHEVARFLGRAQGVTRASPECVVLGCVLYLRAVAAVAPRARHARLLLLAALHLAHKTHEDRAIAARDWPVVWAYAAARRLPPPPAAAGRAAPAPAPAAPLISTAAVAAAELALLRAIRFRTGVERATYVRVYWAVREAAREAAREQQAAAQPAPRALTAAAGRLVRGPTAEKPAAFGALWDPRSPRGSRSTAAAVLTAADAAGGGGGGGGSGGGSGGARRAASAEPQPRRAVSRLVLS